MKIVKTFLFITFSPFFFPLISVATEPGLGICKGKENICCDGYYEENGTCKVCPGGSYGKNCTQTCPENLYGEFCRGKCKCTTEETCNPVKGCVPKGVCTGSDGEFKCCYSYYQRAKEKCSACHPGTHGYNCEKICPKGTYGYFCREKCNCSPGVTCDKQFGCSDQACPPGLFGLNCSQHCPVGWHGLFCKEKCTCETDCDEEHNCNISGSSEPYKRYQFEILIYTLAPIIPAIIFCLMIVFAGKYMQQRFRRRKTTTKNFVDIPPYDISKHRMHHSNGNLQNSAYYKTETENYSTIKTEVDEIKLSAFSQEEKFDDGVYNKLTLRVTGYEEPIARKQLTRRYSDSSSTYMKSSDFSLRRTEEVHNPFQKHRRFSSLRMKNIHKENTGGEMNRLHTMEAGERNVCLSSTKSEECFPLALDGEYVYDMAKFEERNETVGLNHRLLFLKELSSHLLNQKNNIKKNMEIPE